MERAAWPQAPTSTAITLPRRQYEARQLPFVPLASHFDITNGWQVCYGQLHHIAGRIAEQIDDPVERRHFLNRRFCQLPWGRVCLRPVKQRDRYVSGGELWYTGGRIFDVRSLFMQSWARTKALYGYDDLPAIMEQTRDELATVGLRPYQNFWYRVSSITDYILHQPEFADLDISGLPMPSELPGPPEQCIGSVANGYIPGPIYEYDLVSAFASALLDVPELTDYVRLLGSYREQLQGKPASRLIKIAQSVLPGKLLSEHGDPRWHNPNLGLYTRAVTRHRLTTAMNMAIEQGGTIFRWFIDGFYTNVNIEPKEGLTGQLGGWKQTIHHGGMLIGDTSIFQVYDADGRVAKERTNGYTDIDWAAMYQQPLRFRVTRTTTDWSKFQDRTSYVKLFFENGYHQCTYCHDGFHLSRDGYDQWF